MITRYKHVKGWKTLRAKKYIIIQTKIRVHLLQHNNNNNKSGKV